jgi:cell division protein FtsI (penicillin-binding protein 3)
MVFVIALMMAGFGVLLFRLVSLQVLNAEELSGKADRQHEKETILEAERGTIFDRQGQILAINVEVPSVYAIPALVNDSNAVASKLGKILGVNRHTIRHRLESKKNFVWIKRKINPDQVHHLKQLKLEGVGFLSESKRFYPKRHLLGQILGFAGLDNQGLEGIELKYDSSLKGERGWIIVERDAMGRSIFPKGLEYISPSRGKDLVLTIDEVIQHIAERELGTAMQQTSAANGSVIVMDPKTGAILAMAVQPSFNPNNIKRYNAKHWRNRTITDPFEPGSTFKIVAAAAALQEGATTPGELIYCEKGKMKMGGRFIHDHEKYGNLTFAEVIQKSSNIGTAKVAMRLGEEKLYRYIRMFGFGEKTGIDLVGESPGLVREPKRWSGRSLASIAFGQEISVTPIQLITAYAAVANGGWSVQPHIVSEVREPDGVALKRFSAEARRRVLNPETARGLAKILEGTVAKGGTGEKAALKGFSVAGKTGTAQKVDPDTKRYSSREFISSFVGFVPSDDPLLVILVVVDSPDGEAWGGSVAAPVFKRIAEQSLEYLGVLPSTSEHLVLAAR